MSYENGFESMDQVKMPEIVTMEDTPSVGPEDIVTMEDEEEAKPDYSGAAKAGAIAFGITAGLTVLGAATKWLCNKAGFEITVQLPIKISRRKPEPKPTDSQSDDKNN